MSRTARILLAAVVYLLGSVLAFGHASNHCTTPVSHYSFGDMQDSGTYGLKVFGAALFWPFYVAHLAFEPSAPAGVE